MVANLPSGTVTFLFTDIQGSTHLWDAFPDEMRAALAVHDRIIGEAVAAANGAVVKNTGDGIFAVFPSAPAAVAAAIDAQARIAAHPWDPVIGMLEVRMALHTDAAEPVGDDYHGPAINRVARIEAAGHGGQILLSDAARAAAAAALPAQVDLLELGTHRLRGLSRPETIFQIVAPGVRSSFPPLRTASVAAGRLPEFPTSFVGRSTDIEELANLLGAPDCRVVTVLGPGGIGKTRLSVEAARKIGDASGSVAHFVSLVAVPSPEAIIREIADSLSFTIDLHIASMVDETTQVLDLLRSQRMVLVLDNFEHLLGGAPLVTRIVEGAPEVDVIITSRERLGVASEWVYELDGLGMGNGQRPARPTDAIDLFMDRARRAGGAVPPDGEPDVAALCTALGGMPLAIELAAAWTPVLPVKEIAAELQAGLDILAASAADVPERHRSVRAAFEQTWNRLDPDLQASFSRLAIFPAPFTREAAAAITGTTLPTLLMLMNKSLVRRADVDTYDIHPLLRELGLEALGDQREETARKHGEYYVGRLLDRHDHLRGGLEQIEVKDELAAELGNLRPASLWAVANLDAETVVQTLRALQEFYFLFSWAEAIDHFEEMAKAVEAMLGPEAAVDDERYLWAQTIAMMNLSQFGNVDRVNQVLEPLVPHWERRGGLGLPWCLMSLGIVAEQAGELTKAHDLLERALQAGLGDDGLLKIAHYSWYGWVIIEEGDAERARSIFEEGLAIAEGLEHYSGRAYLLSKLGVAADELGNHQEAADYHHESREIFVKTGDLGGQGYTLSRLSWTYWLLGDYAKAKRYGQEGLEKFDEINHRWGIAASWCRIGQADLGLGDADAAAHAFRSGLDSALSNKMQTLVYYGLMGMGRVYAAQGRFDEATRLLAHNVDAPQNPYTGLARQALDELGDRATDEVRAAGSAMSLDEAVALARGD